MISRTGRILVIAIILSVFYGCRNSTEQPSNGAADAGQTQRLIIYTARDKNEVAAVVDMFGQKYPEYKGKVDTVILPAQAALDRLRAEKANPQAGFLWGGTLQVLEQAANEGLLAPSNPTNTNL